MPTAEEVGALPSTTEIPKIPNTLPNPQPIVINGVSYDGSTKKEITIQTDNGGIVEESDPTVPQWAKEANKPSYTAAEVGARPDDWMPEIRKVYDRNGENYAEITVSDNGAGIYDSIHGSRLYFNTNSGLTTVYDADDNVLNRLYGTGYKPTPDDIGALPSDGTATNASKLGGKNPEYYMPDYGRRKTLWGGDGESSWSSGTITVPNTDNYQLFRIGMSGQGTAILAVKSSNYIRGIGGYSSATPSITTYHFAATFSGDVWTLVTCNGIRHISGGSHGDYENYIVTSIMGLC